MWLLLYAVFPDGYQAGDNCEVIDSSIDQKGGVLLSITIIHCQKVVMSNLALQF